MADPATRAVAGISDHAGWAVVVCVASLKVLDSRRIELVGPGLPNFVYHHAAQKLPINEAVALVERVQASVRSSASAALDQLPAEVDAIAIRKRPLLPATIAERITSYWAQNRADAVMCRDALAEAASGRGWSVYEYDAKTVFAEAADVLAIGEDIASWLQRIGKDIGPPWRKDHKLATAAAIAAGRPTS